MILSGRRGAGVEEESARGMQARFTCRPLEKEAGASYHGATTLPQARSWSAILTVRLRSEQAVACPYLGRWAATVGPWVAAVGGWCHTEQGMANKPIAPSRGPRKVTVSGDLEGDYVVREQRDDGTLILKPETAVERARREHGLEPASLAEFEAEYGAVQPPDGEG
jgi:hypothetical protein